MKTFNYCWTIHIDSDSCSCDCDIYFEKLFIDENYPRKNIFNIFYSEITAQLYPTKSFYCFRNLNNQFNLKFFINFVLN